jgi:hypothetical protein
MGENPARANPETDPQDGDGNEEDPLLSLESEGPHSTTSSAKVARKLGNVKQWEVYANMEVSGMPAWDQETDADLKPTVDTSVSEVLSHPVLESFTVTPTESPPQLGLAKGSLVEVPLLTETEGEALEERDDGGAGLDADQTACRGFFFKVSLSCLGLVLGYSNERPRRRVTGSDGWSQGESCCWRHTEIDVLVCRIFQYHERKTLFFVCTFLL